QAGGNHKTVDARSVGDLTDDLVIVQVDDDHLGAVADIKPMAENIDGQVIPTALAADGDVPEKMIGSIRGEQGGREEGGSGNGEEAEPGQLPFHKGDVNLN